MLDVIVYCDVILNDLFDENHLTLQAYQQKPLCGAVTSNITVSASEM